MKKRRLLWVGFFIVSLVLGYFSGLTIYLHRQETGIPQDSLIGNKAGSVQALKERGFPFSFLVIGDTQSSSRAAALMKHALKDGESSFIIILGDFVTEPGRWYHRFFLWRMTREVGEHFPVFLVSGNHDIDFAGKIKSADRRVTPEVYESLYGPRDFSFVFNDCLFIICGIDAKDPGRYINTLKATLSEKAHGKRAIFVFMHLPLKGLGEGIATYPLPHEEEFFSLLEQYRVTTCFFGDYHGYWRVERAGTAFIVSGGGGAFKQRQPEWGRFHHILKITVDKTMRTDGIMTLPGEGDNLQDRLEKGIFTHVLPWADKSPWIPAVFFVITLSCAVFSAIILFRLLLRKRAGV